MNLADGCSVEVSQPKLKTLCAGFEELCTINQNFKPFASTLFGRAGLTYDVDQHTIAELERLDISLVAFLQVLSDHFLLNGAIKALEFLIRRFRYVTVQ